MVPLATLNGVWVGDLDIAPDVVSGLLDRIAATGLPHCLQARPGAAAALEAVASERGMSPAEDVPLMVLERLGSSVPEDQPSGFTIRALAPEQRHEHVALAAIGFGAAEEHFGRLISPELVRLAGTRMYLGEVDGEPVSTGLGSTRGGSVAIFNVATPVAHRRRGYGAAVTMQAVQDGFDSGASWAWLQASPLGCPVYERLGFRTVESWRCWVAAA